MSEIFSRVTHLVGLVTDQQPDRISVDDRFESLTNWTSFTALRLLSAIERDFGTRLDLRKYFAIKDVGGLVQAVSASLGASEVRA